MPGPHTSDGNTGVEFSEELETEGGCSREPQAEMRHEAELHSWCPPLSHLPSPLRTSSWPHIHTFFKLKLLVSVSVLFL